MKKIVRVLAIVICALSLFGCSIEEDENYNDTSKPVGSTQESSSDTVDEDINESVFDISEDEVSELFKSATEEIINLATEDPATVLKMILGNDIEIIYEEVAMNNSIYYKTTGNYNALVQYYSDIFTEDALNWVLATKFLNMDNTLYCSSVGGASGWIIENLSVEKVEENSDWCIYEAKFEEFEQSQITSFEVKKTNAGYRISSIDYCPSSLENRKS